MKKLSELTPEEIKSLFKCNKFMQERAQDYAQENAEIVVSEILHPFNRMHGIDYNIGYPANYFTVQQEAYKDFLDACENHDFSIFSEELENKIKRANDRAHFFNYLLLGYEDISDSRYRSLEAWLDGIVEEAAEAIVDYCVAEYDAVFDTFVQIEAAEMFCDFNDNYETDGAYIYETTRRKYA